MTIDMFAVPTTRDLHAEFEAFWSTVPERKGDPKAAAKKVWLALGEGQKLPPLESMLAAGRAYAAHHKREKTEPKFIPHTRTWLHQQRFRDWMAIDKPKVVAAPDWADADPLWSQWKAYVIARDPRDWYIFLEMRPELTDTHAVLWFKHGNTLDRAEIIYERKLEQFLKRKVKMKREDR